MDAKGTHISIVCIGHSDTGKSTTLGHLYTKIGSVSDDVKYRSAQKAKAIERQSSSYAFIVDRLPDERKRGSTIELSFSKLETKDKIFSVIDTPGIVSLTKTAIYGIALADCALLFISASEGEFEAGISTHGQTKELALIAFASGIKQVIVIINKMDCPTVHYSESRFNTIKSVVSSLLTKIGFQSPLFIPISGFYGDNLTELSSNTPWYLGPSLLSALDTLQPPKRFYDKPLRFSIVKVFKVSGYGTVFIGKVQTGTIKLRDVIEIAPQVIRVELKKIERFDQELNEAVAGDLVGLHAKSLSVRDLKRGDVVTNVKQDSCKAAESFLAHIMVINHKNIREGYTPVVHCHTAYVACKFSELILLMDRHGNEVEKNPKTLKTGDRAIVKLTPTKPFCTEPFVYYPPLGRIIIRDSNKTIAIGIIK